MQISYGLIGEDSLLIQCGNLLLSRHHHIEIVVSPNKIVIDWASKNNIRCVPKINDLLESNLGEIDYLFSIVNSHILSNDILNLATNAAINYHNSPLPKYAGLNATTWAIINDEKEHGVTWHVISNTIDEGDIVKQRHFPIDPDDTAFTLNLHCYEEAIQSFNDMIIDIEQNRLSFKQQDLNHRSYFGMGHVLDNYGFIDWTHATAASIERINRALTLGHYDNDVGTLKIRLANHYVIVSNIEISSNQYKPALAGTVLAIDDTAMYVATITQPIKIKHVTSMKGRALTTADLIQQYGICVGYQFLQPQDESRDELNQFYSSALKSEKFWVNQLKDTAEHAVFSGKCSRADNQFTVLEAIELDHRFQELDKKTKKHTVLAAILIYLYRLNEYEKASVFVLHDDHRKFINQCGNLFSSLLPLAASWHHDITLGGVVRYIAKCMKQIEQKNIYLTDISARHPVLDDAMMEPEIVINLSHHQWNEANVGNTVLYFQYDPLTDNIHVSHRLDLAYKGGELNQVIANLTQHVSIIMDKLLNNSHALVKSLCFLTQSERQTLLVDWGQGRHWPLPEHSIFALFEQHAIQQPNQLAIVMGDRSVSYYQLWELAEKVASSIRMNNMPAQSFIGIYINRSIEMLAIMLGVLKADCVYVPLDTKYPLLKIDSIIHTAELAHIITSDKVADKLIDHFAGKQIITLHMIEKILANSEISAPQEIIPTNQKNSDKLAYLMFTSGTTGAPKGVMVTQRNVINYCQWFCETSKFTSQSTIDFSSSIAFDLSVPCTLAPLMSGGKIAICDEAEKTNPQRYLHHLINNKVTHTELTPGYVEMLLNYPDLIRELVDLQVLLLGADVVLSCDVSKWLAICPHHQVVNEYGPTETTVSATSYFVNKDAMVNEASVPIGRPAFNSSCYLLDKYGNLAPAGIKGELHIGGAQVANGYLGKPTLTQEKFVTSSFQNHPEIIYKTGDLACWLPDGNLQFFGRNDHQVKIQGYRIELAGIESVLLKLPAIHQAVVVVKQGHYKEKYLRAYLVTDTIFPTMNEIKSFLSAHLPIYMIPKEICITQSIPLKENEKIDFERLDSQPCEFLTFDECVEHTLSDVEKVSMRVWQHAFNNNAINSQDDFFEIGGDSLVALQIITELKQNHQIDIPLYYLFEYPTIEQLSQQIELLMSEPQSGKFVLKSKPSKTIIKLSTGAYKRPLFLVHPVGGSVFWYKQLAKHLDGKYTVYGIQDPSIDGCDVRFDSLEEMAKHYINEIKTVYDGDNYCLGGASFGATVAFEMAHQLRRSNKEIEFLGLFDGWAAYPDDLMKEPTVHLLSQRDDNFLDEHAAYLNSLEEYRKALLLEYKLSTLNANAVLFKACELWESFIDVDDPHNGWRPFIEGKITTHEIQGNHETMFFDPNVGILAKYLDVLNG